MQGSAEAHSRAACTRSCRSHSHSAPQQHASNLHLPRHALPRQTHSRRLSSTPPHLHILCQAVIPRGSAQLGDRLGSKGVDGPLPAKAVPDLSHRARHTFGTEGTTDRPVAGSRATAGSGTVLAAVASSAGGAVLHTGGAVAHCRAPDGAGGAGCVAVVAHDVVVRPCAGGEEGGKGSNGEAQQEVRHSKKQRGAAGSGVLRCLRSGVCGANHTKWPSIWLPTILGTPCTPCTPKRIVRATHRQGKPGSDWSGSQTQAPACSRQQSHPRRRPPSSCHKGTACRCPRCPSHCTTPWGTPLPTCCCSQTLPWSHMPWGPQNPGCHLCCQRRRMQSWGRWPGRCW